MKNYAFIFARGGSKGLVRKNIKLLKGKPLLQYSIESARSSALIEKIFLSTDDEQIAEIGRALGAIIIARPAQLATDTSPEWLSWRHAVSWVQNQFGEFDTFVSLPITSPLRSTADIESALGTLRRADADICISVTPANRSPYFNMVKRSESGLVELISTPQGTVTRRQDAPAVYDITTVVYATTPNFVLSHSGIFTGKVTSIIVPKERAVDIDDIYDFMLAEAILEVQSGGHTAS